jgi:signal transduction histidine kinase
MELVGNLASGVAHDFNNLLVSVLGGCDLLLAEGCTESERRQEVEAIQAAGLRAAELVRQLLTFSRKGGGKPARCDLNARIRDIGGLVRRTIGGQIELDFALSPQPVVVTIDPSHLDQILMNLAVNAKDAMPAGGRLRFETRMLEVEQSEAGSLGLPSGRWAELTVVDTGTGMSPEVRARIFEPFFTTKEQGKGTGLGLSTVFGIVQEVGGQIAVESAAGAGSTFRLLFPPAAQSNPALRAVEPEAVRAPAAGEKPKV